MKLGFKTYILIILLLSFDLFAAKHHLIFVHGLNSNSDVFVDFKDSLFARLNKEDSSTDWKAAFFEYPTGTESTYKFSKSLNQFLIEYFSQQPLQTGDKFSFVVHSQGGLVTGIWIGQSLLGRKGFSQELLPHLNFYITLGTPYWGSQLSKLGSLNESLKLGFGQKEISDLSPLSNKIYDNKMALIKISGIDFQDKLKNVRFINIIGEHSGLINRIFGQPGDRIVNAASAHMNFIEQNIKCLDDKCSVLSSNSTYHKLSEVYAVDAVHNMFTFDPATDHKSIGLIETPKVCMYIMSCKQPSLNLLKSILLNTSPQKIQKIYSPKNEMFSATINLNFDLNFEDEFIIDFDTADSNVDLDAFDVKNISEHIKIPEIYGTQYSSQSKISQVNIARIYITGSLEGINNQSNIILKLKFKKSNVTKNFFINIQKQNNTQVDIDLHSLKN